MRRCATFAFFLFLLFCFTSSPVLACSTFCLKSNGEILFGRNYDYGFGDGMIVVNKRGVSKVSTPEKEKNVLGWVSKYGSVTFNQYGRENPMGGMNEKGLVIELMWLDETRYPAADSRPAIDVLEWIQFQLDTAATANEVIANSENIRISSQIPLHYLVNDRKGNTATIEFLDGKLVAHAGDKLPVPTLTNSTYESSLDFASKTDPAAATTSGSLDRFVRVAARTKEFSKKTLTGQDAVNYAFEMLSNAAQPDGTQWSIVYDQKRSKIYYRTRQNGQIRSIDTNAFDYGCSSPVLILDANASGSGDVTKSFVPYTRAANRDLIERSFSKTDFLKDVPAAARDTQAVYPESFACSVSQPLPPAARSTVGLLDVIFPPLLFYKQFLSS